MGKRILITGSTDGIGKLAAEKLAKAGHVVYLHGRNEQKLNKVTAELRHITGNESISGYVADFSNLSAVRKMSEQITQDLSSLDVLINNAGVFLAPNPTNENGIDLRMVVNYLAPFIQTNYLLRLLRKGKAPRLINLSSAAQASVDMELLTGAEKVSPQESYAQSKLAILMWSFYLAKQEPNITITALNPGSLLNTNMVREAYGKFWSPAAKGANIIYEIAVSEKYSGVSGKYFDNDSGDFSQAHSDAYDEKLINALIAQTEEIVST